MRGVTAFSRLEMVAPGFWVATSRCFITTTTVVAGAEQQCLIVDAGVEADELEELAQDLFVQGLSPVIGFSTHPHWDHVLWSRALGDVPRYASQEAVDGACREYEDLSRQAQEVVPGYDRYYFARLIPLARDAYALSWDGPRVRILTHRAHAPGHSALFFSDRGILVAGDMLSDVEIPLLDLDQGDPVGDYRRALSDFAMLEGVRLVIPGHGHWGDAQEFERRLAADFRYLEDLESGRPSFDERLNLPWLRQEDARHRRRIGNLP